MEIFKQSYEKKSIIQGVEIHRLRLFPDEGGSFCEVIRVEDNQSITFFNEKGDQKTLEGFCVKQMNASLFRPGPIKAWHLHKKQTDVWMIPPGGGEILAGLYDLRDDSPTKGVSMRIYLGEYHLAILRIPPGIAHGYRTLGDRSATLLYLIDEHFSPDDELRLKWDALPFDWNLKNE